MRKILAAGASLVVLGGFVGAGAAQDYDIAAHCAEVAAAAGGSYTIEASCRKKEETARSAAAARQIEAGIRAHCDKVGAAVGGCYPIFIKCVDQEEAARGGLQRHHPTPKQVGTLTPK